MLTLVATAGSMLSSCATETEPPGGADGNSLSRSTRIAGDLQPFTGSCSLRAEQSGDPASPVLIDLAVTNRSAHTIKLLRYNNPFDRGLSNAFSILHNGTAVAYVGPVARRAAPAADDYVTLAPGEQAVARYGVAKGYQLTERGDYVASLRIPWFEVIIDDDLESQRVSHDCGTASFGLTRAPSSAMRQASDEVGIVSEALTTSGCNATQASEIARASAAAKRAIYPNTVLPYTASGAEMYGTWFGSWTSTRAGTVRGNYDNIWVPIRDDTVKYKCGSVGCMSSWFAYTFGDCPTNTICLCNVFWSGGDWIDVQMATVVHEGSHLFAGTADLMYGPTSSMTLAASNPNQAITNADNYAYFSEDTWHTPVMASSWMSGVAMPLL